MATGQRIHRLQLGSWSLAPVHGCINQTHLHAMHNTRERREGNPWRFQKSRRGSHPVRLDALNRCLLPRQDVRTLDRRAKSSRCRFALLWPAATSAPVAPTKCGCLQCAEDAMPPVASFGHLASGSWLETPPKPNPTGYLSIQLQPAGSRAV